MRGPIRILGQKFGWDYKAEIEKIQQTAEAEDVRKVSKLIIATFGGITALGAWQLHEGTTVNVEIAPDNTATAIAEVALEGLMMSPLVFTTVAPVAVVAEGAYVHRLATQRAQELASSGG